MSVASLQEVFRAGFGSFARGRQLHSRELRAAHCISHCYTAQMGSHTVACLGGDYEHTQFHACRHRSCPRCAEASRVAWIEAEFDRLLPCAHFHAVFTLPHSLLALWERNRQWFINTLFDCTRQSLLQLLADPRHLGAMPGLLMSLHTWGRNLSHHPHVHCLISAGGLTEQGQWRDTRPGWLLPLKPLQALFRGKLLDALWRELAADRLQLPPWTTAQTWRVQIKRLYRRHWNIEIRPPYEHGRGVVLYLARYAKGGPLPAQRPLHLRRDGSVALEYTDHRDGRRKTLRLSRAEFIARVLWHAPPRGTHTTRHAGLYSSAHRAQHAQACDILRQQPLPAPTPWPRPTLAPAPRRCPRCGGPLLRLRSTRPTDWKSFAAHHEGENSLSLAPRARPPPTQRPARGPTGRSNGPSTASTGRATPTEYSRLRAASADRCGPLN